MTELDVGILGGSKLDETGSPTWQVSVPITDDTNDVEGFGNSQVFQGLGLSSMPYPKDEDGYAEGIFARNCGGRDAICIGGRDTRSAKILGNLKPGDTVLHSTGPSQAAQVQLKEEKRQVVLVTKDADGFNQILTLDGANKKFQLSVNGAMFEIDPEGGITLTDASGGAGIRIANGQVNVFGRVVLGGGTPNPAMAIMLGVGQVPGPAAVLLTPAAGVFIGL